MKNEKEAPIKRHHVIEFRYALSGVWYALRTQPNFIVHTLAALVVFAAAYYFQVSSAETLVLILTVFMVITAELVNTALETVVDLITQEHHPKAKVAKDLAAAAVLLTSLAALFVGIIIFLPKILTIYS